MQTYELIEKQHQLLMQSAVLRLQFQEQVQHVIRPLSWVNKVHKGLSWLKNHPEWPIATLTRGVHLGKQLAYRREQPGISGRIAARGASDR